MSEAARSIQKRRTRTVPPESALLMEAGRLLSGDTSEGFQVMRLSQLAQQLGGDAGSAWILLAGAALAFAKVGKSHPHYDAFRRALEGAVAIANNTPLAKPLRYDGGTTPLFEREDA